MPSHSSTPRPNLFFEISGEIKPADTNPNIDSSSYNEVDERRILSLLKEEESNINREIQNEISSKLNRDSHVEIRFESGSILVTGLIIMEFLGTVSGTVSFFEYTRKLIKYFTERAVRSRLNNIPNNRRTVSIQVIPYSYSEGTISEVTSNEDNNQNGNVFPFNISPAKMLVYITLINIIFFLGGTLFNVFQVNSIQQRFDEANQKYQEVKTKYDSASQLVAYAKIKYQSELENTVSDVISKKSEILSRLSSDTITVASEVSLLNEKIKRYFLVIDNLNRDLDKSGKAMDKLNSNIERLQDKNIKFNTWDIWRYITWDLRVILLIIFLSSVIMLFLLIRRMLGLD